MRSVSAVARNRIPVHDGGIVQGDRRDHLRHGEDDVEVLAVEQLRGASVDPSRPRQRLTRGTMPVAAAVVPDPPVSTAVARLDMAAEGRGSTLLDGGHHTQVRGRQRGAGPGAIHVAVLAEDLRHAKERTSHGGPRSVRGGRRGLRAGQQVERARRRTDLRGRQPEVARRGFQSPMAEQQLNVRTSVPTSSKWTAKAWRSECGVTGLPSRLRYRARRHAHWTVPFCIGCPGCRPGKSHRADRSIATRPATAGAALARA